MHAETRHPSLGFGLGLRVDYYDALLEHGRHPAVDWLEVLSEN